MKVGTYMRTVDNIKAQRGIPEGSAQLQIGNGDLVPVDQIKQTLNMNEFETELKLLR